jgi:hypothetical protein
VQSTTIPYGPRNPRGHSPAEILGALQGQATYTAYDPLPEEAGMSVVIVDQGEVMFLTLLTSVDYYLRLFTNDVSALSASAREALTETSFSEPTFAGYAAATLTGGLWSASAGAPSFATYAKQGFVSSASQPGQDVHGYYVTRVSTGALAWFEEFTAPVTISGADQFIEVTPRLTMMDTGD